jgi:hypothetical protein
MTTVVLTQPFLFPWVGLWEQMKLADVFVHYDDVQFSKGHFTNRVQIKTESGPKWMTIPIANNKLGTRIDELETDDRKNWRQSHRALVTSSLGSAPYVDQALDILDEIYAMETASVGAITMRAIECVAGQLGFGNRGFLRSSDMNIEGSSSQRVLDIVKALGGDVYVTGLGARHYLDHELFERAGVDVQYMNYAMMPYPQQFGEFTPYVSVLDLIANTGTDAPKYIQPRTVSWRDVMELA